MLEWVACRHEVRPWRQASDGGTRDDRLLTRITVTIPEPIGTLSLDLPAALAAELDVSIRAVTELDATHGRTLGALSGLLLRSESVASSRIERITATADEYARAMHGSRANASAVAMVAGTHATGNLMAAVAESGRITAAGILAAHVTLMSADSAEQQHAGHLRDMQNWVGGSDHSPRGALLIPPPPDIVAPLFDDVIAFSNRTDLPSLLQAAIAHAQFETVHPFTDGNGRIGRALVNAILRRRQATTYVVIPLASALVARRDQYFAHLDAYREGDVEPIIREFAGAARIAATESARTAEQLALIPEQWRETLGRTRAGSAAAGLLELLMSEPVLSAADVEQRLGGATSRIYSAIDRLAEAQILRPLTARTRNQVWAATAILAEVDDLGQRIEEAART